MINKVVVVLIAILLCVGAFLLWSNLQAKPSTQSKIDTSPTTTMTDLQDKTAAIQVTANGFEPQTLTIPVGTRVNWINKSGKIVSLNSADHPTHLKYPPLNRGRFPDGSAVQVVFDKPGTYKYHNHYISTQTGTVVVK